MRFICVDTYREILTRFVLNGEDISQPTWASLIPQLRAFVLDLSPTADTSAVREFVRWVKPVSQLAAAPQVQPNTFLVENDDNLLRIDVSSIHGIKGETHAATLVLETFYYDHFFKCLMPWLVGDRTDARDCSQRQGQRLRAAYVAMSRPVHLLCLAMPRSSVGEGDQYSVNLDKLRSRGWNIVEIAADPAD